MQTLVTTYLKQQILQTEVLKQQTWTSHGSGNQSSENHGARAAGLLVTLWRKPFSCCVLHTVGKDFPNHSSPFQGGSNLIMRLHLISLWFPPKTPPPNTAHYLNSTKTYVLGEGERQLLQRNFFKPYIFQKKNFNKIFFQILPW